MFTTPFKAKEMRKNENQQHHHHHCRRVFAFAFAIAVNTYCQSEHRVQMATQPTICYALLEVLRTEYVGVWWQAKTIPQSDMCVCMKKRNMPLNIAHIKPIKSRS